MPKNTVPPPPPPTNSPQRRNLITPPPSDADGRAHEISGLKGERTRLQRERQHNGEEIRRLVGTIAAADTPSPSLTERLGQLEESAGVIDRRLGEIDSELHAIAQSSIDPAHVAATLAEFNQLWDVLYPQEKTCIVHLLVERVVFEGDQGGIQVVFHPDGCRTLAVEPQGGSA